MSEVIVNSDILSTVPAHLNSVVDSLLKSARENLQKAQDMLNNKKIKSKINSIKRIDNLISDNNKVVESVYSTRTYTTKMVSLIRDFENENKMNGDNAELFATRLNRPMMCNVRPIEQGVDEISTDEVLNEQGIEKKGWFSSVVSFVGDFFKGVWGVIKKVAATIAAVFTSVLKGLSKVVESIIDCVIYLGGAIVTGIVWIGDLVHGTNYHEIIWEGTKNIVGADVTGAWYNAWYESTAGKLIKENSLMDPYGKVAGVICFGGEILGMAAITAASGGVINPATVAAMSAAGSSFQNSVISGESFGQTLLKGAANAGIAWVLGKGAGSSKVASVGANVKNKASNILTKVKNTRVVQWFKNKPGKWLKNTGSKVSTRTKNLYTKIFKRNKVKTTTGTNQHQFKLSTKNGKELFTVKKDPSAILKKNGKYYLTDTTGKVRAFSGKNLPDSIKNMAQDISNTTIKGRFINPTLNSIKGKVTGSKVYTKLSGAANNLKTATVDTLKYVGSNKLALAGAAAYPAVVRAMGPTTSPDVAPPVDPDVAPPTEPDVSPPTEPDVEINDDKINDKKNDKNNDKKNDKNNNKKNDKNNDKKNDNPLPKQKDDSSPKNNDDQKPKKQENKKEKEPKKVPIENTPTNQPSPSNEVPNNYEQPTDTKNEDTYVNPEPEYVPENNPKPEPAPSPVPTPNPSVEPTNPTPAPSTNPSPNINPNPTPKYFNDNNSVNVDRNVVEEVANLDGEVEKIPLIPETGEIATIDTYSENLSKLDGATDFITSVGQTNANAKTGVAIPVGLGVTSAGAAAVAGVRYVRNRKQNEDVYNDTEDEENTDSGIEDNNDYNNYNSEYMDEDYLVGNGENYADTDNYIDDDSDEEDIALNQLNDY